MSTNPKITDYLLTPITKYRTSEEMGRGAYGVVYKGFREDDNQAIALKRIFITDKEGNNDIPLSTHRELNALRKLNSLNSRNIVRLFDVVINKCEDRLCMDLIFELGDCDLEQYLKKFNSNSDISLTKITNLSKQLIEGIHFMHSNRILHRDLKPANILINREGTELKITDFGLARILGFDASLTPVVVTLWYRSPEILLQRNYSTACDIWSAGCIIGEMIYGRAIFAAEDEVKQLEKIILRLGYEAIDNWPEDCFIDCSSFVDIIDTTRDLNFVLKRADRKFRNLIIDLLRFNPNHRMISTLALTRISELVKSEVNSDNSNVFSIVTNPSTSQFSQIEYELISQNEVVNSVVRNVLDDDFHEKPRRILGELPIPGIDTDSLHCYPHEEVEISNSNDHSTETHSSNSSSLIFSESVEDNVCDGILSIDNIHKDSDEVGDSFSSYRSQNNCSFSSYGASSQTGADDETDEKFSDHELNELDEFGNNFLLFDKIEESNHYFNENTGDSINEENRNLVFNDVIPITTCNLVTPNLLESTDSSDYESTNTTKIFKDKGVNELIVQNCKPVNFVGISPVKDKSGEKVASKETTVLDNAFSTLNSTPLKEHNGKFVQLSPLSIATDKHSTRKRIFSAEESEESADELRNYTPLVETKKFIRQKSLRRRLSISGPHVATNRKTTLNRSESFRVSAISENDENFEKSFGEKSLYQALQTVSSPLTDRPKVLARRRSQAK